MRRAIAVLALVAGLWITAPAQAAGELRLMFQSGWSGTSEVYAADPSGESPTAQATLGFVPSCGLGGCDFRDASFGDVVPSPNRQLILYTEWSCNSRHQASLFEARADGTHPRTIARAACPPSYPGCGYCIPFFYGSWAPDSNRIAYAANGRIHIVVLDGSHNRIVGRGDRVSWSPDGTSIAFSNSVPGSNQGGSVSVRRNGHTRVVAPGSNFWWSPNGRWLAYCTWSQPPGVDGYCGTAAIVRRDGSMRRAVLPDSSEPPKWSGDSRFLSIWTPHGVTVLEIANRASYTLGFADVADSAGTWQQKGHMLAVAGNNGTYFVDAATRAMRLLTTDRASAGAAWSPDGSYLAYTTTSNVGNYSLTDLHVVTPSGKSRTLVSGGGPYGGDPGDLVWTRAPKNADYRPPPPRVLAAGSGDGITAPWPVTRLAADGDRVAYSSCGHVFVWTPTTQTVVQAEPNSSLYPRCAAPGQPEMSWTYTLALSGDRVAYAWIAGGSGKTCALEGMRIGDPSSFSASQRGDSSFYCGYDLCSAGFGDLAGANGLLVFSTWARSSPCPGAPSEQEIHRLDFPANQGDPSDALIATSPGPLVPFDIDAGRIVAGGANTTVLFAASGTQLLSIPVSPLAAQLSGSDLVMITRGQLLDYDSFTGARLHSWPVPDVPSGADCGSPYGGTWECRGTQLVLEDEAHGLAAYLLNGQLHLLRLSDGQDKLIGAATLARFMNAGLVYVDGARITFIPYSQLGA